MIASLIIADSESDSNLFYACRFSVPDPVIYFEIKGKKHLVLSDLEIDRAKVQAQVHYFHSLSEWMPKVREHRHRTKPGMAAYALVVDLLFKKYRIKHIEVPTTFPSQYYVALKKLGYQLTVKPDPFFPARLVKSLQEKKHIRHALQQVEFTLKETFQLLEKSKIKGNKIFYGKELVTSEFLKTFINTRLMERGCVASHTIVASGAQGSLPHHEGSGPIIPHTPIIFDIFPQHSQSHYHADMTRTVVKGKPTAEAKKMYAAVLEANLKAQAKIKAGVTGAEVHQVAADILLKHGFKTGKSGKNKGRLEGYIHSTGHGLGLDVHEPPSVSPAGGVLKPGHVVTVEPGLYYKKWGGIRIEDVVYVTPTGSEPLTHFPRFFQLG